MRELTERAVSPTGARGTDPGRRRAATGFHRRERGRCMRARLLGSAAALLLAAGCATSTGRHTQGTVLPPITDTASPQDCALAGSRAPAVDNTGCLPPMPTATPLATATLATAPVIADPSVVAQPFGSPYTTPKGSIIAGTNLQYGADGPFTVGRWHVTAGPEGYTVRSTDFFLVDGQNHREKGSLLPQQETVLQPGAAADVDITFAHPVEKTKRLAYGLGGSLAAIWNGNNFDDSNPLGSSPRVLSVPDRLREVCAASGVTSDKVLVSARITSDSLAQSGVVKSPQQVLNEVSEAIPEIQSLDPSSKSGNCGAYFDVYINLASMASPTATAHTAGPPVAVGCTTTSSGSCIRGGEFCPTSDNGTTGTDGAGRTYVCEDKTGSGRDHWETP